MLLFKRPDWAVRSETDFVVWDREAPHYDGALGCNRRDGSDINIRGMNISGGFSAPVAREECSLCAGKRAAL